MHVLPADGVQQREGWPGSDNLLNLIVVCLGSIYLFRSKWSIFDLDKTTPYLDWARPLSNTIFSYLYLLYLERYIISTPDYLNLQRCCLSGTASTVVFFSRSQCNVFTNTFLSNHSHSDRIKVSNFLLLRHS